MKTISRWIIALLLPMLVSVTACAEDNTPGKESAEFSSPQLTSAEGHRHSKEYTESRPQPTATGRYTPGKEYSELPRPQPTSSGDKIEVVELFWYGCSHCYELEPYIHKWLENKPDDVEFVRLPAVLSSRWELLAKAYYTAEILGILDKSHTALFDAIHRQNRKINDEAALQGFFVSQGVSAEDFKNTFNSFAINVKINHARMMTRRYATTGVPMIVVNGKYKTSKSMARSNTEALKVVDYLVEKERR